MPDAKDSFCVQAGKHEVSQTTLALLGRMIGLSWLTPLPCCNTSLCTYGDRRATCTHGQGLGL